MQPKPQVFALLQHPALRVAISRMMSEFSELDVVGVEECSHETVARIVRLKPQLVLWDMETLSGDAVALIDELKVAAPDVKVLALAAFGDSPRLVRAIQAGAAGVLAKRSIPRKLRWAIARVLTGGVVVESSVRNNFGGKVNPWHLADVELEVLGYLAKGLSNAEVGSVMSLSRRTIRTHLSHIYGKMGIRSRVQAVTAAVGVGSLQL